MTRNSSHDLHELARRVEAEHRAMAKTCERRWLEELERRRRQLAAEVSRLLQQH